MDPSHASAEPTAGRSARLPGDPPEGPDDTLLAAVTEVWTYRELLRVIAVRDLLVRYKQSLVGAGWALFVPLANMAVFTVLFTRVVRMETELPYPIFVYAGLLPWTWFASALSVATSSLTQNMGLVTRVYFPREILPLSAVLVTMVDFLLGGVVLGVLMVLYGVVPGPEVLLLPLVVGVQLAFTVGLGLLMATGNLFFRDVRYLMTVLVGIWMFLTPVLYPLEKVGGRLETVLRWNPMAPVIESYRWLLLGSAPPATGPAIFSVASSLVLLAGGWLLFHRLEPRFAEVI
ncbi:MAG: ABC transporter permease [Gemmatimonadota bacterium]|jgi:ABC-type polysaccharide/polyol phosphate export permease